MNPEEILESLFRELKHLFGEGEEMEISLQGGLFSVIRIRGINGFLGISKNKGSYFHFYIWEKLPQSFYPVVFRLSAREFFDTDATQIKSICVETKEGTNLRNSFTIDSPLYNFIEEEVRPRFHMLQKKLVSIKERTTDRPVMIHGISPQARFNLKIGKIG